MQLIAMNHTPCSIFSTRGCLAIPDCSLALTPPSHYCTNLTQHPAAAPISLLLVQVAPA